LPPISAWPGRVRLAVAPGNSQVAYILFDQNSNGAPPVNVYFTNNRGGTWSAMDSNGLIGHTYGGYALEIAVDPIDSSLVYVGGENLTVHTGPAFGGNWSAAVTNANIHADQHVLAFPPCSVSPCPYYLGNDGGVFFLQPQNNPTNVTVVNCNDKLAITQFWGGDLGIDFVNDPRAIGGTQDNGTVLFVHNDPPFANPYEWDETFGGDGGHAYLDHNPANRNFAFTVANGPLLEMSTFWGYDWSPFMTGITGAADFLPAYVLDRSDDSHLAYASGSAVFEITGAKNPWHQSSPSFSPDGNPQAIAIAPSNSAVIYAGLSTGRVFRTGNAYTQGAATYVEISGGLPPMYIAAITVDPVDSENVYLAGTCQPQFCDRTLPQEVFRSVKKKGIARSWTNISGNLPRTLPAYSILVYYSGASRVLVIGTDAGVFFSVDEGQTWNRFNAGLPNTQVLQVAIDGNQTTIAAFTFGRGVFSTNIGGSCNYSITPASQSFPSAGGTSSVAVTAPAGCSWSAASGASWVTVTSGASGAGNGTVTYSVAPNSGASPRSATITIAGQAFTVTEVAGSCSSTLAPSGKGFTPQGGSSSVVVTASCAWTASSGASWITITAGSSGTGNGTVFYSVAANATVSSRVGTLSIAGQTFTVMQAGGITAVSATASSTWTGSSPALAIDGDTGTYWNSGNFPPGSIDVDLGASYDVTKVRLNVAQNPSGSTTHEIWGGPSLAALTLLQTLTGVTSSGQWLESLISPAAGNVRFVRIRTTASPSWVAWSEIEVYGTPSTACTPQCTGHFCGNGDGCGGVCSSGSGCALGCHPACGGLACGDFDPVCGDVCQLGSGCV
jgi:hypothetical protein